VFFLLQHAGGLSIRQTAAAFFASSLICSGLVLAEEVRSSFLLSDFECESVCVSISITHKLVKSPLSAHTHKCTYKHSHTDRREDFRQPMPASSVKLIRHRAPDNSIISSSLDNRKPLTTAKAHQSHIITKHYCISYTLC